PRWHSHECGHRFAAFHSEALPHRNHLVVVAEELDDVGATLGTEIELTVFVGHAARRDSTCPDVSQPHPGAWNGRVVTVPRDSADDSGLFSTCRGMASRVRTDLQTDHDDGDPRE